MSDNSLRFLSDENLQALYEQHRKNYGLLMQQISQLGLTIPLNSQRDEALAQLTAIEAEQARRANKPVVIEITNIKAPQKNHDPVPAHVIDWTGYFEQHNGEATHAIKQAEDWNATLLPQLCAVEAQVSAMPQRQIQVYGTARLSVWLAFGYVFRETAGYTLAIDQYGQLYRTNVAPNSDFKVRVQELATQAGNSTTVAVGINISDRPNSMQADMQNYVEAQGVPAACLIEPIAHEGARAIRDAGDATALAFEVKQTIRQLVAEHEAEQVLLFYAGPSSTACIIGYHLNATSSTLQLMEHMPATKLKYAPSFLLQG